MGSTVAGGCCCCASVLSSQDVSLDLVRAVCGNLGRLISVCRLAMFGVGVKQHQDDDISLFAAPPLETSPPGSI